MSAQDTHKLFKKTTGEAVSVKSSKNQAGYQRCSKYKVQNIIRNNTDLWTSCASCQFHKLWHPIATQFYCKFIRSKPILFSHTRHNLTQNTSHIEGCELKQKRRQGTPPCLPSSRYSRLANPNTHNMFMVYYTGFGLIHRDVLHMICKNQ